MSILTELYSLEVGLFNSFLAAIFFNSGTILYNLIYFLLKDSIEQKEVKRTLSRYKAE